MFALRIFSFSRIRTYTCSTAEYLFGKNKIFSLIHKETSKSYDSERKKFRFSI